MFSMWDDIKIGVSTPFKFAPSEISVREEPILNEEEHAFVKIMKNCDDTTIFREQQQLLEYLENEDKMMWYIKSTPTMMFDKVPEYLYGYINYDDNAEDLQPWYGLTTNNLEWNRIRVANRAMKQRRQDKRLATDVYPLAPLRYHFPHQVQEYGIAEDYFRNMKKAPKGLSEAYLRYDTMKDNGDANILQITPAAYARRMWVKKYIKDTLKPLCGPKYKQIIKSIIEIPKVFFEIYDKDILVLPLTSDHLLREFFSKRAKILKLEKNKNFRMYRSRNFYNSLLRRERFKLWRSHFEKRKINTNRLWKLQFPSLHSKNYDPFYTCLDFTSCPCYQDTEYKRILDGVAYKDTILTNLEEINTFTEQLLALIYIYPEFEETLSDLDNLETFGEPKLLEESLFEGRTDSDKETFTWREPSDELIPSVICSAYDDDIDWYNETKAIFLENLSLISRLYSESSPLIKQLKILQEQTEALKNSIQLIIDDILKKVVEISSQEGKGSQEDLKSLFKGRLSLISILYSQSSPLLDKVKVIRADVATARDTTETLLNEIFYRVEKELDEEEQEELEQEQEIDGEEEIEEEEEWLKIKEIITGHISLIAELSAESSSVIDKLIFIKDQTQAIRKAIQSIVDNLYDHIQGYMSADNFLGNEEIKEIFFADKFSMESVNYLAQLGVTRLQTLSILKAIESLIDEILNRITAGSPVMDEEEEEVEESFSGDQISPGSTDELVKFHKKHLHKEPLSENFEKLMSDVLEKIDIIVLTENRESQLDQMNELFMADKLMIENYNYLARLDILKLQSLSIWETMESLGDEFIENRSETKLNVAGGEKSNQKELELYHRNFLKEVAIQQKEYCLWKDSLCYGFDGDPAVFTELWLLVRHLLEHLFDVDIICEKEMLEIDKDILPETMDELLNGSAAENLTIPFVECLVKEITENERKPGEMLKKVVKCNQKWKREIRNCKLDGYLPALLEYLLNDLLFPKSDLDETMVSDNLKKHLLENMAPDELDDMQSIAKYLLVELLKYHIVGSDKKSSSLSKNEDILSFAKCLLKIYSNNGDEKLLNDEDKDGNVEEASEERDSCEEESEEMESSVQSMVKCDDMDEATIMQSLIKCLTKYVDSNELIDEILKICIDTPDFRLKNKEKSVNTLFNLFNDYIKGVGKKTIADRRDELKSYLYSILIDNVFKTPSLEKIVLGQVKDEEEYCEEAMEEFMGESFEESSKESSGNLFDEIFLSWLIILIEIQNELDNIHNILTTRVKPKSNWEMKMDIMITGETEIDIHRDEYFAKMAKIEEFLINLKENINDLLLYLLLYQSMIGSSSGKSSVKMFGEEGDDLGMSRTESSHVDNTASEDEVNNTHYVHLLARLEQCKRNLSKINSGKDIHNKTEQLSEENLTKQLQLSLNKICASLMKTNDSESENISHETDRVYHMFLFEAVLERRISTVKKNKNNALDNSTKSDPNEINDKQYRLKDNTNVKYTAVGKRRNYISATYQEDSIGTGKENAKPCIGNSESDTTDDNLSSNLRGMERRPATTNKQIGLNVKNTMFRISDKIVKTAGLGESDINSNVEQTAKNKIRYNIRDNKGITEGNKTTKIIPDDLPCDKPTRNKYSKRQFGSCDVTNVAKKVFRTSNNIRPDTNINSNTQSGNEARRAKYRRREDRNKDIVRDSEEGTNTSTMSYTGSSSGTHSDQTNVPNSSDHLITVANMGLTNPVFGLQNQNVIALNMAVDNSPAPDSVDIPSSDDEGELSDTVLVEQNETIAVEEKEDDISGMPLPEAGEIETSAAEKEMEQIETTTLEPDQDAWIEQGDEEDTEKTTFLLPLPGSGEWVVVELPGETSELETAEDDEKKVGFKLPSPERLEEEEQVKVETRKAPFNIPWAESSKHPDWQKMPKVDEIYLKELRKTVALDEPANISELRLTHPKHVVDRLSEVVTTYIVSDTVRNIIRRACMVLDDHDFLRRLLFQQFKERLAKGSPQDMYEKLYKFMADTTNKIIGDIIANIPGLTEKDKVIERLRLNPKTYKDIMWSLCSKKKGIFWKYWKREERTSKVKPKIVSKRSLTRVGSSDKEILRKLKAKLTKSLCVSSISSSSIELFPPKKRLHIPVEGPKTSPQAYSTAGSSKADKTITRPRDILKSKKEKIHDKPSIKKDAKPKSQVSKTYSQISMVKSESSKSSAAKKAKEELSHSDETVSAKPTTAPTDSTASNTFSKILRKRYLQSVIGKRIVRDIASEEELVPVEELEEAEEESSVVPVTIIRKPTVKPSIIRARKILQIKSEIKKIKKQFKKNKKDRIIYYPEMSSTKSSTISSRTRICRQAKEISEGPTDATSVEETKKKEIGDESVGKISDKGEEKLEEESSEERISLDSDGLPKERFYSMKDALKEYKSKAKGFIGELANPYIRPPDLVIKDAYSKSDFSTSQLPGIKGIMGFEEGPRIEEMDFKDDEEKELLEEEEEWDDEISLDSNIKTSIQRIANVIGRLEGLQVEVPDFDKITVESSTYSDIEGQLEPGIQYPKWWKRILHIMATAKKYEKVFTGSHYSLRSIHSNPKVTEEEKIRGNRIRNNLIYLAAKTITGKEPKDIHLMGEEEEVYVREKELTAEEKREILRAQERQLVSEWRFYPNIQERSKIVESFSESDDNISEEYKVLFDKVDNETPWKRRPSITKGPHIQDHRCPNPVNCTHTVESTKNVCVCCKCSEENLKKKYKKGELTTIEGPADIFLQIQLEEQKADQPFNEMLDDVMRHDRMVTSDETDEIKTVKFPTKAAGSKKSAEIGGFENEELKKQLRQLHCLEKLYGKYLRKSESHIYEPHHGTRNISYKKCLLDEVISKFSSELCSSAEEDAYTYLSIENHDDKEVDKHLEDLRLCQRQEKRTMPESRTLARKLCRSLQRAERNERFDLFQRKPYRRHKELAKMLDPEYIIERDSTCDVRYYPGPMRYILEMVDLETLKKYKLHKRHCKYGGVKFGYENLNIDNDPSTNLFPLINEQMQEQSSSLQSSSDGKPRSRRTTAGSLSRPRIPRTSKND